MRRRGSSQAKRAGRARRRRRQAAAEAAGDEDGPGGAKRKRRSGFMRSGRSRARPSGIGSVRRLASRSSSCAAGPARRGRCASAAGRARGERLDVAASGRRGGKGQFVVVAAGEQACCVQAVGAGLERGARQLEVDAPPGGTLEDVADVGEQAVGDVDRRRRQAAQGEPERDARLRPVQRGEAIGNRRPGQTDFSLRWASPSAPGRACRTPRLRRRPARRRGVSACPCGTSPNTVAQRLSGPRVVSPPMTSTPNCLGAGEEAAREGGDPGFVGLGSASPAPPSAAARPWRRGRRDSRRAFSSRGFGLGVGQEMRAGRPACRWKPPGPCRAPGARSARRRRRRPAPYAHGFAREVARDQFEFGRPRNPARRDFFSAARSGPPRRACRQHAVAELLMAVACQRVGLRQFHQCNASGA
jgi:hypothetical protein